MQFWTGGLGITKSRYDPHSMLLTYSRAAQRAQWAERAGFGGFTATEHHFEYNGWWPSPLVSLAAAALATARVRLSPGTMLLPLHDPLRAAEDACLLDVLSKGRLWLGFGYGYQPMEFLGLGTVKKTRGPRLVEQMQLLRLALSGGTFSYHGKYYRYEDVRIRPRPIQRPHPPLWLHGGTSFAAASRAGANGFPYMAANLSFEDYMQRIDEYYRAAEEAGVDKAQLQIGAVKDMHIAATREDAERLRDVRVYSTYSGEHMSAYGYLVDREGEQVYDEAKAQARFQQWVNSIWVGTPHEAIDELERYRSIGVDVIIVGDGGELFAREVLPHFLKT